jgi:excisionase family DNA binding protein
MQQQTITTAPVALRRKEAARALGLSITTVDRAIKRGDLHAKKYGARILVPRAEIDRYLAALQEAYGPPAEDA